MCRVEGMRCHAFYSFSELKNKMVADGLNHLWTGYQMTHEVSISISYSYVQTIVEILFIELSYMLVITGSEKPLHYEYSYELLGLKPPFPSLPPSIIKTFKFTIWCAEKKQHITLHPKWKEKNNQVMLRKATNVHVYLQCYSLSHSKPDRTS